MDEDALRRYSVGSRIITRKVYLGAPMLKSPPKPGLDVMRRVEELLREQLVELGEDPDRIKPHEFSEHMRCGVHPSGALSYVWKGTPVLDVDPELQEGGIVRWRFFTRDTPVQ